MNKRMFLGVVLGGLLLISIIIAFSYGRLREHGLYGDKDREATLTGHQACVPHKSDGPTTLECLLGFQAESGEYYVLQMPLNFDDSDIMTGAVFTAKGTIKPTNALKGEHWKQYDIVGTFEVTEVVSVTVAQGEKPVEDPGVSSENPVDMPPTTTHPIEPPSRGDGDLPVSNQPADGCYVGGCSSQICSDQPDTVSTCEYRDAYACYNTATCERQVNGQCGWTKTDKLVQCLNTAETGNNQSI